MSATARVLLVEDDKFLRRACEASLRKRGFDVTTASDGEEGLRMARLAPYADIILLDLLMPKMPGIEVLRALKSQPETSRIPVLILSNSSREDGPPAGHAARGGGLLRQGEPVAARARRAGRSAGATR